MTDYVIACKILKANGWSLTNSFWVHPYANCINDTYVNDNPKLAVSAFYNWDDEVAKFNKSHTSQYGWYLPTVDPAKPKESIKAEGYEDWETFVPKPIEQICYHNWVKYTGLTEEYYFCRACDAKKQ